MTNKLHHFFALSFLLVASLVATTPLAAQTGQLVLDINFDNYPGAFEDYNVAKATADFDGIETRAAGEIRGLDREGKTWPQRTKVGEGHLRAHFPALMATGQKTGFLFDKAIPATEGAIMEYKVKFSEGFQWKLGGKLPGLGGGSGYPVGCTQNMNTINNGFTTRLMWRRDGNLVVYTYLPDRDISKCGFDLMFFRNAETNRWYKVKQHLTLNAPGQHNGVIRMYVDDVLVYEKKDLLIRLQGKDDVKINRAIMHNYSGGSDNADWWSTVDQYVHFDDFKVWVNTSEAPETALQVNLTTPTNNQEILFGSEVTLAATAMDAEGIAKVVFSVDDVQLSEDATAPYTATWTPPAPGIYNIKATAVNTRGTETVTSARVRIYEQKPEGSLRPVYWENFDRGATSPLSDGGVPAAAYTTSTTTAPDVGDNGGTSRTRQHSGSQSDYMLQLLGQHTGQTGNYTQVAGTLSSFSAPFRPVLNENTNTVSWRFAMKNNRNSTGGTAGFTGTQVGMAVVLAADDPNFHSPSDSKANGYAVVLMKHPNNSGFAVSLVKFTDGLGNRTILAGPSPVLSTHLTWMAVRVDYNPQNDEWVLYFRDDQSNNTKGDMDAAIFPVIENSSGLDADFTGKAMTHFGFALNTTTVGATGAVGNAFTIDDFRVGVEQEVVTSLKGAASGAPRVVVYPNPSKGKLSIAAAGKADGTYAIYQLNGARVATGKLSQATDIDLAGKAKGLLLVKIITNDWVHTQKVLVE